jgi:hypothetical protein
MTQPNPFDHAPDPVLGRLLREHLEAENTPAFVAQVQAAARMAQPESFLEVLAEWTRPGLAAAAILILAVGMWLSLGLAPSTSTTASLEEGLIPGRDVVIASVIEGQQEK